MQTPSLTDELAKATEIILNEGTILYPTDTVWGIGGDATSEIAVTKIIEIKERIADKSFVVLVPDIRSLAQYVAVMPLDIEEIIKSFNEPTTIIFPNAINLALNAVNNDGSIAIRIPKDDFCKRLLKKVGKPLISTSANISGKPTPSTFSEISNVIKDRVDYVINYYQNITTPKNPSKIVRILNNGKCEFIR